MHPAALMRQTLSKLRETSACACLYSRGKKQQCPLVTLPDHAKGLCQSVEEGGIRSSKESKQRRNTGDKAVSEQREAIESKWTGLRHGTKPDAMQVSLSISTR